MMMIHITIAIAKEYHGKLSHCLALYHLQWLEKERKKQEGEPQIGREYSILEEFNKRFAGLTTKLGRHTQVTQSAFYATLYLW